MNSTATPVFLIENVTRQSKRIRDLFDIPLHEARKVLAKGIYCCSNWEDLCARLKSGLHKEPRLVLAELPTSNSAEAYFQGHVRELAQSFSRYILTNSNLLGLYQTLRTIFCLPEEAMSLADVAQSLSVSEWKSAGIGPDPAAVIEATTCVNNVPIKLIATRIYFPANYNFPSDVKIPGECAEPHSDGMRVVWSDPGAWYDVAYNYLTADEDDENWELNLPVEPLDDAMKQHEEWLVRIAEHWKLECSYGDHGEGFLPYIHTRQGCYLIFGVPCPLQAEEVRCSSINIPFLRDGDTDSTIVLLDGQPLCFEQIHVETKSHRFVDDFEDYFECLKSGIFSHDECDLDLYYLNGWDTSFFFIKPVTNFDVDHFLRVRFQISENEEAITLKSDNLQAASVVIDKIFARDVMMYTSGMGNDHYLMEIDTSKYEKDMHSLSILLDVLGNRCMYGANLISGSITQRDGEKRTLYVDITPKIFILADVLGKKAMKEAIGAGLVLHRPLGFHARFDAEFKPGKNIRSAPREVVELFESTWDFGSNLLPHELFSRMRRTKYRRDNY